MAFKWLCLALALFCAVSAAPESRIVGGSPVTIQEFPYISAFIYYYPRPNLTIQRCVGSIVSSWHVLTTAYCFTGADLTNMWVRAGSTNSLSGGTEVNIREVIVHPSYTASPRVADIAVAFLTTPLRISDTINVLFIPSQGTHIPDGLDTKIVSWGFESEGGPQLEILKTVNLRKLPLSECQAIYEDVEDVVISEDVICATSPGRGLCTGDSGAPMVYDSVLLGLSSYFRNCTTDDYPDVFTRIDSYTNWIIEVTSSTSVRTVDNL